MSNVCSYVDWIVFFFFKQKTAYEMRISDWSSDVCSSDLPKDKAVQVNATVRKTSAGAADSVPVVRVTNLSRTLREVQKLGVWIYGLAGDATASLYALDLSGNVALVLGGEADGLRRLTREQCDQLVTIPDRKSTRMTSSH